PGDGGDGSGDERGFGVDERVVAGEGDAAEGDGHEGGDGHGYDFAPGVDTRPVPVQDVDGARAEADVENELPSLVDGGQTGGGVTAAEYEKDGEDLADQD